MSRSRQISAVSSIITAELVALVIEVIDVSGVAEQLESFHDGPGLVSEPPSARIVGPAREGVRDRVEVRAHMKSVDLGVVACVHDRRDLTGAKDRDEATEKLGRADATGKSSDHL